ncbi:MAG TPA: cytochrome c oxidase assembly protein [Acidobacteriaceae bacterium]
MGRRLGLALICCGITASPHAAFAHHVAGHEAGFWQPEWPVLAMLIASLGFYVRGVQRLWQASSPGRGVSRRGVACFIAGWLVLAAALMPPVHTLGETLFSVHMVEHELLMTVAAPLLVLGRPLIAFLWALPQPARRDLGWLSRTGPVHRVWLLATSALVAWAVHALALWVWHLPALFEAALARELVHSLQHVCFLGAALLYWTSLLHRRHDAEGRGVAVISLFATTLHSSVLGALLTLGTVAWYPLYSGRSVVWGLTAIEDQQLAGLVMWVPGGLVYMGAALALAAMWLRESETRARRWETALLKERHS